MGHRGSLINFIVALWILILSLECVISGSMEPNTKSSWTAIDRKPLSDCAWVNVLMDGHRMTMDNGDFDILTFPWLWMWYWQFITILPTQVKSRNHSHFWRIYLDAWVHVLCRVANGLHVPFYVTLNGVRCILMYIGTRYAKGSKIMWHGLLFFYCCYLW